MTSPVGTPASPARSVDVPVAAPRRKRRIIAGATVLGLVGAGTVAFLGLQVVLEWDDGCSVTPPGYFQQEVLSVEQHAFYNTCVLDPHNGEPVYTIHRPWQSVHGL